MILSLEWSRSLGNFGVFDKLNNAWFQSVTLRTAGFNSIDISQSAAPTMLIMMALMFVGGSPGGTAGGVKTVTIGVLMAALWTNVVGRKDAEAHGWEISSTLVYRAIAIFGSGVLLWFVLTFMLTVTQAISTRDIIFEATSALATVGLSTGATGQLDEIGKCLIIIGMFVGRIGPLTLFVLLTQDPKVKRRSLPQAEIPLS
ncbi:MAG: potassium transporter TrkG [Planctomycetota bacterium]